MSGSLFCCSEYRFPVGIKYRWKHIPQGVIVRGGGGMASASYAPQPGTVEGKAFRQEVRKLFEQYAEDDRLVTHVTTVCYMGQMIGRE